MRDKSIHSLEGMLHKEYDHKGAKKTSGHEPQEARHTTELIGSKQLAIK
jgi:hypothetical protein